MLNGYLKNIEQLFGKYWIGIKMMNEYLKNVE